MAFFVLLSQFSLKMPFMAIMAVTVKPANEAKPPISRSLEVIMLIQISELSIWKIAEKVRNAEDAAK